MLKADLAMSGQFATATDQYLQPGALVNRGRAVCHVYEWGLECERWYFHEKRHQCGQEGRPGAAMPSRMARNQHVQLAMLLYEKIP